MRSGKIGPLRVGLMVPINNTTMERELLAWLPAGSRCTTLRIPRVSDAKRCRRVVTFAASNAGTNSTRSSW